MGALLENKLKAIDSPCIIDIRAKGLFCGEAGIEAWNRIQPRPQIKYDGNHFAKILMKNGFGFGHIGEGLITKATLLGLADRPTGMSLDSRGFAKNLIFEVF